MRDLWEETTVYVCINTLRYYRVGFQLQEASQARLRVFTQKKKKREASLQALGATA